ncbi:MAG: hypothetical protein U1F10_06480 [Burkholderiales bacterium]
MEIRWTTRVQIFLQRFWQPTSACMTCMPGSLTNVASAEHWMIALQTGLGTALLALAISFTPLRRLYTRPYSNAAVVAVLTTLGDLYAHRSHYGGALGEALLTGAVSGALALVAWFLLEDRARRVRAAWAWVSGRRQESGAAADGDT